MALHLASIDLMLVQYQVERDGLGIGGFVDGGGEFCKSCWLLC